MKFLSLNAGNPESSREQKESIPLTYQLKVPVKESGDVNNKTNAENNKNKTEEKNVKNVDNISRNLVNNYNTLHPDYKINQRGSSGIDMPNELMKTFIHKVIKNNLNYFIIFKTILPSSFSC